MCSTCEIKCLLGFVVVLSSGVVLLYVKGHNCCQHHVCESGEKIFELQYWWLLLHQGCCWSRLTYVFH
jgi:hypothetical protein